MRAGIRPPDPSSKRIQRVTTEDLPAAEEFNLSQAGLLKSYMLAYLYLDLLSTRRRSRKGRHYEHGSQRRDRPDFPTFPIRYGVIMYPGI